MIETPADTKIATCNLPVFKLFGLQRTGTNVMQRGLVANFKVRSGERGREWKHGRIKRSAEDGLRIVICTRNPLAWLDAMFRFSLRANDRSGCKHFRKRWSFKEFCMNRHYHWPNPVLRWNVMNGQYCDWIAAHPTQGILVRSEELMGVKEQEAVFARVGAFFGWERKDEEMHTFRRRVPHAGPRLGKPMDWNYYRDEQYAAKYDEELLEFVGSWIDRDVARRLSYSV